MVCHLASAAFGACATSRTKPPMPAAVDTLPQFATDLQCTILSLISGLSDNKACGTVLRCCYRFQNHPSVCPKNAR